MNEELMFDVFEPLALDTGLFRLQKVERKHPSNTQILVRLGRLACFVNPGLQFARSLRCFP